MMKLTIILMTVLAISFVNRNNALSNECNERLEYSVNKRGDGGYELSIMCVVRSFLPISVEGFFPKRTTHYHISIIGNGKDLSYRNHNGFYYSINDISSNHNTWDLGYVWVDKERENIYLNLYWLSTPDGLKPSEVHGKYRIK